MSPEIVPYLPILGQDEPIRQKIPGYGAGISGSGALSPDIPPYLPILGQEEADAPQDPGLWAEISGYAAISRDAGPRSPDIQRYLRLSAKICPPSVRICPLSVRIWKYGTISPDLAAYLQILADSGGSRRRIPRSSGIGALSRP
jgi:hypothetical protein